MSVVKLESPTASIEAVDVVSIVKVEESISIWDDGAAKISPDAPERVSAPEDVVKFEDAAASIETEEVVSIVRVSESISIGDDVAVKVSPDAPERVKVPDEEVKLEFPVEVMEIPFEPEFNVIPLVACCALS